MKMENFRNMVRDHVRSLLNGSDLTFGEILQRSLNCDPSLLKETLSELYNNDFISTTTDHEFPLKYKLKVRSSQRHQNVCLSCGNEHRFWRDNFSLSQIRDLRTILRDIQDALPDPTPAYYQWWFSNSIYENLIKLLLNLSKHHTSTAFLGSGTLGVLFSHFSVNRVNIFDIDQVLLTSLKPHCSETANLVCYDASKELEDSWKYAFQLVFVDPPWSSSLLQTFLIRGASLIGRKGKLAISFPQLLTRPTIPSEQKMLIKLAAKLGLSLELILHGFTEYSIPHFEYNAYKHHGIELKVPWRKGDLFIFTKTSNTEIDYTGLIQETPKWDQFQLGKSRIFLKRDGQSENGSPSIEPLADLGGLEYKSTSSRCHSWKSASLVSTRNCVAHAHGRKQLSVLLRDILNRSITDCHSDLRISFGKYNEIKEYIYTMLSINKETE